MPAYDPAFALGPFLQLPPYLPSCGGFSDSPWWSKGRSVFPGCKDAFPMSVQAPLFVPGAAQASTSSGPQVCISLENSAFSKGGDATPFVVTMPLRPGVINRGTDQGQTKAEATGRSASPSVEISTSASSDGAHDDRHQEIDAIDAMSQQSMPASEQTSKVSDRGMECTADSMLDVMAGMTSYDCSYSPEGAFVMDPEAEDPVEPTPAASSSTSSRSRPQKSALNLNPLETERLDCLLGCWFDAKDSFYEVTFDAGTTTSCHVKTTRPGGAVRDTDGLIRIAPVKGKNQSRIIWGSAFVLELPTVEPNYVQWTSIRGGKDFTWTRAEQIELQKLGVAADLSPILAPAESPSISAIAVAEPEVQRSMQDDSSSVSSKGKSITRGTWRKPPGVWRAVDSTSPKTPSEVAAAPCRSVKSKSGEVRVITKDHSFP